MDKEAEIKKACSHTSSTMEAEFQAKEKIYKEKEISLTNAMESAKLDSATKSVNILEEMGKKEVSERSERALRKTRAKLTH